MIAHLHSPELSVPTKYAAIGSGSWRGAEFAENHHAVGQSTVESIMRFTNRVTNGRRVTVIGYGSTGRGVAAHFRNAFSIVSVFDIDPVVTLQANLDGFLTPERTHAISSADLIITATGAPNLLTADDLEYLRDEVVLANVGHFPQEIDVAGIQASGQIDGAGLAGGHQVRHLTNSWRY